MVKNNYWFCIIGQMINLEGRKIAKKKTQLCKNDKFMKELTKQEICIKLIKILIFRTTYQN